MTFVVEKLAKYPGTSVFVVVARWAKQVRPAKVSFIVAKLSSDLAILSIGKIWAC